MESVLVCEELLYLRSIRGSLHGFISASGILRELYHDIWEMIHAGYYKHVSMEFRMHFREIGQYLARGTSDFRTRRFILDQIGILVGGFDDVIAVSYPLGEAKRSQQSIQGLGKEFQLSTSRYPKVKDVADLQDFFNTTASHLPCIIRGGCNFWMACSAWNGTQFWNSFEHRFVPVEIGSYLSEEFEQKLVDLKDFVDYIYDQTRCTKYKRKMYLAQYELLDRFVTLAEYMDPPPDAMHMIGRLTSRHLFIGPAGTVTALHTDPHDNFFCQVIGEKYIRLHPPSESHKLYVRTGISESKVTGLPEDLTEMMHQQDRYPVYHEAVGYEVNMLAGDCLFIPAGWFHFVKSYTPSISVAHFFE